ncbi:MAG: type II CRISPR RNA-guided endonuclease Cas9 [Spiroplasma sp.]
MNEKKYYLGLDLGISSVGWAVMAQDKEKYYIDDFGVRLFDCSEDPTDGTTNAEQRRIFRSTRRLNRRRKQRINQLKLFLEQNNIISKQEITDFFNTFKITNNIQYDDTKYFNPYVIRVKGLTKKLTPSELTVALINIANHRGYNDKFSFNNEEKENKKSKLSESIDKAEIIVKQYQTIAHAILTNSDFKNPENEATLGLIHNKIKKSEKIVDSKEEAQGKSTANYRYLFARQEYKKELELILVNQEKYYPQLSEKNRNTIINDIILRQRDFEVGPGPKDKKNYQLWKEKMPKHRLFQSFLETEGNCTFYRQEKRGYRCSLTFELFRFISDFSTFTVKSLDIQKTKKIANIIFSEIILGEIPDKNRIKKIIKENTNNKEDLFTSNKAWKELKVNFGYLKLMREILPTEFENIDFNNLSSHMFNKIGKILHQNLTPQRRKNELIKFFNTNKININEKEIENKFLQLPSIISTSTSNASFKYMQEAINAFNEQGTSYGNFQADFNKINESKMFTFNVKNELFMPIEDPDLKKNAVVFRAVNQARKIIKALHEKYNYFQVINVEVARDLAKSFKQRKEIKKNNELNADAKLIIEKELENNNINPNKTNVLKYRLWDQQNQKCIYCQNHHDITLEEFNSKNNLQIDHIIPQSKISDDSLNNLVLVCSKANQEKTNQTPLQWLFNNKDHLTSYINFCNSIKNKLSAKKYEYLLIKNLDEEMINDFASRNLNDTRYITRYVTNWLKAEFKNWEKNTGEIVSTKVQAILGSVTSRFRRIWLQGSPWGLDEKVREITPFHHAVDAMVLTQFISSSYVNFATDAANIINLKRSLSKHYLTLDDYNNHCKEILTKWKTNNLRFDLGVRLEKLIDKNISNFKILPPLVENLKETIESRIPISLKIDKETKEIKLKNSEETVPKTIDVPKFIEVLNQEKYYLKIKQLNLQGDLHYPFISYKINTKLSGSITSSQMPVNQHYELKTENDEKIKELEQQLKQLKTKNKEEQKEEKEQLEKELKKLKAKKIKVNRDLSNNESYFKDKHNTLWEINNYYGVVFDEKINFKPHWIRNINATKEELNKYKKHNLLVLRTTVEYFDKKKQEKVIKIFNGKNGHMIYSNLLGTTNVAISKKNESIFGKQNYRDSIGNWEKDFKILKPNILGKVLAN